MFWILEHQTENSISTDQYCIGIEVDKKVIEV